MNSTDGLGDNLVLKGGTALKKLYFAEYRFSEDLDYSTRVMGPITQIDSLMETVVHSMDEILNERGPFQVEVVVFYFHTSKSWNNDSHIVALFQFTRMRTIRKSTRV